MKHFILTQSHGDLFYVLRRLVFAVPTKGYQRFVIVEIDVILTYNVILHALSHLHRDFPRIEWPKYLKQHYCDESYKTCSRNLERQLSMVIHLQVIYDQPSA